MSKELATELLKRKDVYLTENGRQELIRIVEREEG
ncbi:hypothetical protein BpOF4_19989 (plasmid) [Alkalihalophilus pseudofirmus OF4]|uniref:Uncharacterized protein n=1 Tax=Alkalihalophilus pseudofirmus (strain ATCC BAA-2126 / JCM 17055 / OF4) TaxID=398511 RepID=D3G0X1_ALKPO|nr:hypothetical protein BpOF4_19989 [Alkalihalophilus pseudofirmus OF4]